MNTPLLSAAACAEIAARAANATAGPWRVGLATEYGTFHPNQVYTPNDTSIAQVYGVPVNVKREELAGEPKWQPGLANGDFLAAAREDIPALLRTVAALRDALGLLVKPAGVISGTDDLKLLVTICGDEPDFTVGDLRRAAAVYAETK